METKYKKGQLNKKKKHFVLKREKAEIYRKLNVYIQCTCTFNLNISYHLSELSSTKPEALVSGRYMEKYNSLSRAFWYLCLLLDLL